MGERNRIRLVIDDLEPEDLEVLIANGDLRRDSLGRIYGINALLERAAAGEY